MKEKPVFKKECESCGKPFEYYTQRIRRFCSKKCRLRSWVKSNYDRYREGVKKGYLKSKELNPVICRNCGRPVPTEQRKPGVVLCSDKCRFEIKKKKDKACRDKAQRKFDVFKLSIGCQACGYSKCPACLDFHHIDPQQKERRITAKMWMSGKPKIEDEIKKCILLCKNCHYEGHFDQTRRTP